MYLLEIMLGFSGHTPQDQFFKACVSGDNRMLSQLIGDGHSMKDLRINVNQRSLEGRTGISYAVCHGNAQNVMLLVRKFNIDVNLQDNRGWSPAHYCLQSFLTNFHVLKSTNRVNWELTTNDGYTPLMLAIKSRRNMFLYPLTEDPRINVNFQNNMGQNALMTAFMFGNCEFAKVLLQHPQIQWDLCNVDGLSAPFLAVKYDQVACLEIFLSAVPDYDFSEKCQGSSLLFYAALNDQCGVIDTLLRIIVSSSRCKTMGNESEETGNLLENIKNIPCEDDDDDDNDETMKVYMEKHKQK